MRVLHATLSPQTLSYGHSKSVAGKSCLPRAGPQRRLRRPSSHWKYMASVQRVLSCTPAAFSDAVDHRGGREAAWSAELMPSAGAQDVLKDGTSPGGDGLAHGRCCAMLEPGQQASASRAELVELRERRPKNQRFSGTLALSLRSLAWQHQMMSAWRSSLSQATWTGWKRPWPQRTARITRG